MMRAGLLLYDLLAGKANLERHRWMKRTELCRCSPELNPDGLPGAFTFFNAQRVIGALGFGLARKRKCWSCAENWNGSTCHQG
jgi:glycerol-3-phosphate dehydrogenase